MNAAENCLAHELKKDLPVYTPSWVWLVSICFFFFFFYFFQILLVAGHFCQCCMPWMVQDRHVFA